MDEQRHDPNAPGPDERDAGEPDPSGHVEFGGGMQHGGGMVQPEEFPDGGTDVLEEEEPEEHRHERSAGPPH